MIENLQERLYHLEKKQANGSWIAKIPQKRFSNYLKERVCKMKQYMNYMLIVINQNVLAILRKFSNLKNFTPRRFYWIFSEKFLTENN